MYMLKAGKAMRSRDGKLYSLPVYETIQDALAARLEGDEIVQVEITETVIPQEDTLIILLEEKAEKALKELRHARNVHACRRIIEDGDCSAVVCDYCPFSQHDTDCQCGTTVRVEEATKWLEVNNGQA